LFAHSDTVLFSLGSSATTQDFAGLFETGNLTEQSLLRILGGLQEGTTELVCHPGYADLSGPYVKWGGRRELELATLTSASIREAIRAQGLELVNYRQL
jgi:predicted glycoside hydrolase/deacetylase ChbG (UPF0249 family)